tara:strand:+ start:30 stop:1583 length:1554 start_codon:yes stop_codon:yes gene_type:complete
MARYSPFTGGPAATDVSGLFAQFDSGAIARGVASAGQSIGNALAQRYAQAAQDKKDASLTDTFIQGDGGEEMLNYLNIDKDDYKNFNNSEKAGLFKNYQNALTTKKVSNEIAAQRAAAEDKVRIENSDAFLVDSIRDIRTAPNAEELNKRLETKLKSGVLTGKDALQLEESYLEVLDRITPDATPKYVLGGDFVQLGGTLHANPSRKVSGFSSTIGKIYSDRQRLESQLSALEQDPTQGNTLTLDKAEQMRSDLQKQIETFDLAIKKSSTPSGTSLEVGKDGRLIFKTGNVAGKTIATTTDLQKQQIHLQQTVRQLEYARSLFEDDYVGLFGYLGKKAVDEGIGSLPFEWAQDMTDEKRIKFRNAMLTFNIMSEKIISGEVRFTDQDRKYVQQAQVDMTKAFQSPADARDKMRELASALSVRAVTMAKEEGKDIGTINWVPPSTSVQLFKTMRLNREEADKLLDAKFKGLSKVLDIDVKDKDFNEDQVVADLIKEYNTKMHTHELAELLEALFPKEN